MMTNTTARRLLQLVLGVAIVAYGLVGFPGPDDAERNSVAAHPGANRNCRTEVVYTYIQGEPDAVTTRRKVCDYVHDRHPPPACYGSSCYQNGQYIGDTDGNEQTIYGVPNPRPSRPPSDTTDLHRICAP